MPTVPTLQRQVSRSNLPSASVPTDSPRPAQASTQAMQGAAKQAFEIAMKQKSDADTLTIQRAVERIDSFENQMYDPEKGFFSRKGENALNLEEDVSQAYEQLTSEIEQNLSNDTQRQAFAQIRQRRQQQILNSTRKYEMREYEDFANNQDKANIQLAINLAMENSADPERIDQEILKISDIVLARKERFGMSDAEASALLAESVSSVHLNVMNKLIEQSPLAAQAYFQKNKEELFGQDEVQAQQLIDTKAKAYQADDLAGQIAGTTEEKLSEWLKKANDVEDPELRKMVRGALESRWRDNEVAKQEFLQEAFEQVEQGVDPRKQDWWLNVSPQARSQLESRYVQVRNGIQPQQDDTKYLEFIDMSAKELASMDRATLYTYRSSFDDQHWNAAVSRWDKARQAMKDPQSNFEFSGFQTTEERVRNAAVLSGVLDPDTKPSALKGEDLTRYMALNRSIEQTLQAATYDKGSRLTAAEEQAAIDKVVMQKVFLDTSWFGRPSGDEAVPMSAIIEGDEPYVPLDQIPEQQQMQLRSIVEREGWGRGDLESRIERAYPYWMSGDKKSAWQILKGNN